MFLTCSSDRTAKEREVQSADGTNVIGTEKAMVIVRSIYLVEVIFNLEACFAIVYHKTEIRETAEMFS